MTREQIEKQYNKLVSEIEEKEMYDGRGTVDRYICDTCGHMTHTTYKDKGVTPFVMRCPKCGGDMVHKQTFKKYTVPDWVEVKNWYRPTLEQTLEMSAGQIEYVLDGGLILDEPSTTTHSIILEYKPVLECCGPFLNGKERRRERRRLERRKKK